MKPTLNTARFPTGIIIDLKSQEGNVFHILGVCNRIVDAIKLDPVLRAEFRFETHLNMGK